MEGPGIGIFPGRRMIRFIPYQTTRLYEPDNASPHGAGYFAYFLWKPPAQLPASITIAESWDSYIGYYLFMRTSPTPENMQDFITKLITYLQTDDAKHTSFAWIEYNNATQSLDAVALACALPGTKVLLAKDAQFDFANYSFPLKQDAPVAIVEEGPGNITGFTFEYPAYTGAPPPRQAFNIQLPLTGEGRGTLEGQVSLGDLSDNPATGWNASLYYVVHYNDQDIAQNYPIFNLQQSGLQVMFNFRLDPVDPLNPKRSYLAFTGNTFVLKQENGKWVITDYTQGSQLATFFRTVYGREIDLIPITTGDHPARLVFESLPPVDGKPRYYLAPSGDFEAVVKGQEILPPAAAFQMPGGLSGTESIGFISKSISEPGDVFRFEAGKEAYAPVFPIVKKDKASPAVQAKRTAKAREVLEQRLTAHFALLALAGNRSSDAKKLLKQLGASGKLLNDTYKTSWINVRPAAGRRPPLPLIKNPGGRGKPLTRERINDLERMDEFEEMLENERRLKAMQQNVPVYYSQPNDAALYNHEEAPIQLSETLLQIRDTPAAYFTSEVQQSLPLAPYGGVREATGFTYQNIRDFELQVLTPYRREIASLIPLEAQVRYDMPADDTYVLTTTPQGLLATVPKLGLSWQSVLLAKSESKGVLYDLQFTNSLTRELQDAMQSNQLFLVATEAAPLGTFMNKITIADWPFNINTGKGSSTGNFSNVLIFKFASGSLEERVRDPKSWTNGNVFNENAAVVSGWISTYIEDAKLSLENNSRFRNFVDIVQNPAWNGILALQVDIGVENFPDDLKGLLAGIDRSQFFAHHFGIEVNFVKPDEDGTLQLPKSSLFGLISYVDRGYRSNEDTDAYVKGPATIFTAQPVPQIAANQQQPLYDFKVLTLQVVFANSDIQDFTSRIQLTTTTWFGEQAQLDTHDMGDTLNQQSIEFIGSYEKHNGVRTYTFVTQAGQTYRFLLQSQTMNYTEIVKAQFNTLKVPDPVSAGARIAATEDIFTRFTFWGYMNFKLVETFDVYSFGDISNENIHPRQGLYFASLAVEMNFTLDQESGEVTNRRFLFVPDRMSFDISLSTPRSNSLFTNFPIRVSGIIHSKEEKAKPSDQGFLPVIIQSPQKVEMQGLSDTWYSLVYDLNLGSMGALAAKAGFLSQVSTAWSPDANVRRMAVGVKLPGVGGGQKTLSLQSVLNINIQSFSFISEFADADEQLLAYLLRFNNVKLSLLGKKLPGAADTQFILFGDPTGNDKTTLAWYAAYFRKDK